MLSQSAFASPVPTNFKAGDLAVYRVGTGTGSLGSGGTAVFIDEYTPSGQLVQSVPLPTTASGSNKPLVASGSAGSEGLLTLSGNGNYLAATGYDAAVGASKIGSTAAASVPRTVARISASDAVDTSTALNDVADGNNIRSAVTNDGQEFWVGGAAGGIHYATLGASTSTGLISQANVRQVEIADGQLYTSADTTKSGSTSIATVGTGLPTSGSANAVTNLNFGSGAPVQPYAYSLLTLGSGSTPDTLYVAENNNGTVTKYTLQAGTWTAHGSVAVGAVTGLTANDDNGTVTIYASTSGANSTAGTLYSITDSSGLGGTLTGTATQIATAASNEAFRGIAFTPGTTIGTGSGTPPPAPPTATPLHSGLPAALNDPTNPTDTLTLADATLDPGTLTVTATSSNQAVAADAGISITGTGAVRTLSVTPAGAVGDATITLTVSGSDGTSSTSTVQYAVSADLNQASAHYYSGAGNASTAIDVGDGYFIAGDDESNVLRLYQHGVSGPPVATFNFTSQLPFGSTEIDIEAAARSGNTIYWTGSMSQNDSGVLEPSRSTIFATTISGSGASTTLTYAGAYTGLKADLVAWDQSNGHGLGANYLGLAASAASGVSGHDSDALNVEGMEMVQGDDDAAYLSFRAPLEPTTDRHLALLVPVTNLAEITSGSATHATFGAPILLDLGGLAVRDIRKNADGQYLISAGSADDSNSDFELYTWDGKAADAARHTGTTLPVLPSADNQGSWETVVSVPDPLTSGSTIPMLQDDGDVAWYGDGLTSKNGMPSDLQKSVGLDLSYTAPARQSTSTALTVDDASPNITDTVTFTATVSAGSGASGTPDGTVSFTEAGTAVSGCDAAVVSAGVATCTTSYADTADHTVLATYSGDDDFTGSGSNPVTVTAHLRGTDVTVTPSVESAVPGTDVTASVSVSGGGSTAPSGTVDVYLDSVEACHAVPLDAGSASCDLGSSLESGSHDLTADYSGDGTFAAAASASSSFSIKAAQVLSWPTPTALTYGTALSDAQLDASSTVAGSFVYSVLSGPSGAGELLTAGTVLPAGDYTLEADFTATDAGYAPDSIQTTLTVNPEPLQITVAPTSRLYGQPDPTFIPSATGLVNDDSLASLDGTLAYRASVTLTVAGVPTHYVSSPTSPPGNYVVYASGLSSPNYTITYVTGKLTVAKAPLTIGTVPASRFVGQDDPAFTLTYNGQATAAPAEVAGSPLFAVSITLTQDGV
ncbi:MAG: hypothetical protein JWQ77_3063, partial [Jatrophihabitans sp.]|nr:hypothetical protein [Jatrophihabitans sp.]